MPRASNQADQRAILLADLAMFAGGGVGETPKLQDKTTLFLSHLPIPEHRRVLDRDVLLVLGGRGTGKTQLFRVLRDLDQPTQLVCASHHASSRGNLDAYVAGYSAESTMFPRHDVIDALSFEDGQASRFWLGLLLGALLQHANLARALAAASENAWGRILQSKLREPSSWLDVVRKDLEPVYSSLDAIDEELTQQGRSVIVMYDDLDILAANVRQAYPLIRGLLDFWLRNVRRWRALRCKVFLRTDIFDAPELAFPDSSKLRPLSVTLRWNADSLYRLVLKRLLNGDKGGNWQSLIGSSIPKAMFVSKEEPWGIVPATKEQEHRAFMQLMIGQYMGAEKRRGDTYQWFLNHLQDSRGDIGPRSFLKLFEQAAVRQLNQGPPESNKLLAPEQVNAALGEVSADRIKELGEEYPWIDELAKSLRGKTVPVERPEFRRWLRTLRSEAFPEHVGNDKDRLVDYLINLGILRETSDGRIHVPDIYLFGFALKRKGGIRRPRV